MSFSRSLSLLFRELLPFLIENKKSEVDRGFRFYSKSSSANGSSQISRPGIKPCEHPALISKQKSIKRCGCEGNLIKYLPTEREQESENNFK